MPVTTGLQIKETSRWTTIARSAPLVITDENGKVVFRTVIQAFCPTTNPDARFVAFSKPGYVPLRKGEEKDILMGISELFKQFAAEFNA